MTGDGGVASTRSEAAARRPGEIVHCRLPPHPPPTHTHTPPRRYIGTADDPLQIVRGGIFGGQLPHIDCVLKAYIIAMHQTLTDGYLGTEECVWAIIFARFPHLFAPFDNNSLGNHGDNCASFQKNVMEEDEIAAGTRARHVSTDIPAAPSLWDAAQHAAAAKPAAKVDHKAVKNIQALLKAGGYGTKA